jgi:UDP-N-acetylglucosamine--N-acetylmuramyl-(pentapeptide) pyrophosphoryl-undecaprenol N-acetylglucosamine transferase
LREWGFPSDATVVLVYGGSQGSLAINQAVRDWVAAGLPPRVHLIWGTGPRTFDEFASLASNRVVIRPYLSPIANAYAAADLAVARAGTMTLAELHAWHIPAILIPLPTAAADHQTHNAVALERVGAAVHLPQSQLTATRLGETVRTLIEQPDRLRALTAAAAKRARPDAAMEIARRVVQLAGA